jgi:hypothetical protein
VTRDRFPTRGLRSRIAGCLGTLLENFLEDLVTCSATLWSKMNRMMKSSLGRQSTSSTGGNSSFSACSYRMRSKTHRQRVSCLLLRRLPLRPCEGLEFGVGGQDVPKDRRGSPSPEVAAFTIHGQWPSFAVQPSGWGYSASCLAEMKVVDFLDHLYTYSAISGIAARRAVLQWTRSCSTRAIFDVGHMGHLTRESFMGC